MLLSWVIYSLCVSVWLSLCFLGLAAPTWLSHRVLGGSSRSCCRGEAETARSPDQK